jgi:hypothetical protein
MSSSEPNNNNAVEVNDILFETLMPVRTIQVPRPEEETSVQIGVRITNQSLTPYRFDLPSFIPQFFDRDGHEIRSGINSNARRVTEEEDIPLINPSEQITFWKTISLYWRAKNCFGFKGKFGYGGVWSTAEFNTGTYQFQFRYGSSLSQTRILFNFGRAEVSDFWVGTVSTPLTTFHLVQP